MRVGDNGGRAANYSPNGRGGPVADPRAAEVRVALAGTTGRSEYPAANRADDFEQAGLLYRVMNEDERQRLIANIAGGLARVSHEDIVGRSLAHFHAADPEYGARVEAAVKSLRAK